MNGKRGLSLNTLAEEHISFKTGPAMIARTVQVIGLLMALVIPLAATLDAPWLDLSYTSARPIFASLIELPLLQHRLEVLPQYKYLEVILVLSWILVLSIGGTVLMAFFSIILSHDAVSCDDSHHAAIIVYKRLYCNLFLPPLNSMHYALSSHANGFKDSMVLTNCIAGGKKVSMPKLMIMALSDSVVRHQLTMALIVCALWLLLSLTGPGGPLTSTQITFYFGYPVLHIAFCILLTEISMYAMSYLFVAIQKFRR